MGLRTLRTSPQLIGVLFIPLVPRTGIVLNHRMGNLYVPLLKVLSVSFLRAIQGYGIKTVPNILPQGMIQIFSKFSMDIFK